MNWPQTSATDLYFTFDCGLNVGLGVTKVDSTDCDGNPTFTGTTVEFQPEDNSSPVVATLSPHDWGVL